MAKENENSDKKEPTQYMKEAPFITLPLQAYKTRRNMLLCSCLCAFQAYYGQFGGKFIVLGNDLVFPTLDFNIFLVVISCYFTSYFFMLGKSTLMKWRLRSTGQPDSRVNKTTGTFGSTTQDAIEVPQSTAWERLDGILNGIKVSTTNCTEAVSKLINEYLHEDNLANQTPQNLSVKIDQLSASVKEIPNQLSKLEEHAESTLIAFDKEFWAHQNATKRSFYIWEYGGPLALSILATVGLIFRIFSAHSDAVLQQLKNMCILFSSLFC